LASEESLSPLPFTPIPYPLPHAPIVYGGTKFNTSMSFSQYLDLPHPSSLCSLVEVLSAFSSSDT
jgi:hypothetical protein